MPTQLKYFAWVRERIGKSDEVVELPADLETVAELLAWMRGRGEDYADVFAEDNAIRVAIEQAHVRDDEPVKFAREIAFFPPVTGG